MKHTFIIFISTMLVGCQFSDKPPVPTYEAVQPMRTYETDNIFIQGEILLPDYVHQDTLVVVDADFLNWCMEKYDAGSDGDILDILCVTTVPLYKYRSNHKYPKHDIPRH